MKNIYKCLKSFQSTNLWMEKDEIREINDEELVNTLLKNSYIVQIKPNNNMYKVLKSFSPMNGMSFAINEIKEIKDKKIIEKYVKLGFIEKFLKKEVIKNAR